MRRAVETIGATIDRGDGRKEGRRYFAANIEGPAAMKQRKRWDGELTAPIGSLSIAHTALLCQCEATLPLGAKFSKRTS